MGRWDGCDVHAMGSVVVVDSVASVFEGAVVVEVFLMIGVGKGWGWSSWEWSVLVA